VKTSLTISMRYLKETLHFSAGNYIANILMVSPNFLIPLMILNYLGPNYTAYYYIAFVMISILKIIPLAMSTSLLVEGSHGEPLKRNVLKALYGIYIVLIPGVFIFLLLGGPILAYLGKEYSYQGYTLLQILIVSTIFSPIVSTFYSVMRIKKDVRTLLLITTIYFILLNTVSYVLLRILGIVGPAWAWLLTYAILAIIATIKMEKYIRAC